MSETIKEETAEAVQAEPQGLTLEKFEEATEVVSKVISETKLVYSEYFSNLTGNKVYLKPENMQYTGAYKVLKVVERIARNEVEKTVLGRTAECSAIYHQPKRPKKSSRRSRMRELSAWAVPVSLHM